jgi:hypothetical protein
MARTRQREFLERGDLFFLYRPAVEDEEPKGLVDVQRFFVVLRPESEKKFRLLVLGRKRLPDVREHERFWGFVDRVEVSAKALEHRLRASEYETKTRGERHEPAVRPAGEGVYAITLEAGQMHLSYVLEVPEHPSDVQRAFKIAPEASFALSIKNPEASTPPGVGLSEEQKAEFPEELKAEFRDRRFEHEDVRMLDYPGAEFILVGARLNPEDAYGVELPAEQENYERADIIRELGMAKSRHPIKPLFERKWE